VLPVWIVVVVVTPHPLAPHNPRYPESTSYLFCGILYCVGCRRHLCRLVLTLELNRNWLLAILTRIPTTNRRNAEKSWGSGRRMFAGLLFCLPDSLEKRICWQKWNWTSFVGRCTVTVSLDVAYLKEWEIFNEILKNR